MKIKYLCNWLHVTKGRGADEMDHAEVANWQPNFLLRNTAQLSPLLATSLSTEMPMWIKKKCKKITVSLENATTIIIFRSLSVYMGELKNTFDVNVEKIFSLPFFFCLWLITVRRTANQIFWIFTSCLRLRENAQHPSDLWGTTEGKLAPAEWCLCLAVAVKFKDSPMRDLIPWGIIYGLRNKVVAKYLRNPLQKATRLCWYFLICIKSVPKGRFHCFAEVNIRDNIWLMSS